MKGVNKVFGWRRKPREIPGDVPGVKWPEPHIGPIEPGSLLIEPDKKPIRVVVVTCPCNQHSVTINYMSL